MRHIDILFDGVAGETDLKFADLEDDDGNFISIGEWFQRSDGLSVLRIKNINRNQRRRWPYRRNINRAPRQTARNKLSRQLRQRSKR